MWSPLAWISALFCFGTVLYGLWRWFYCQTPPNLQCNFLSSCVGCSIFTVIAFYQPLCFLYWINTQNSVNPSLKKIHAMFSMPLSHCSSIVGCCAVPHLFILLRYSLILKIGTCLCCFTTFERRKLAKFRFRVLKDLEKIFKMRP